MKHSTSKNFYTRTVFIPALLVATFVLYCFNDMTLNTNAMATSIDKTMVSATHVEEDALAFIPVEKPLPTTFTVADNGI